MKIEPEEEPDPVSEDEYEGFLEQGIALFNDAKYHDAHEAFERVWLSTQGSDADFYKGLIQACICLHHFQRENLDGAAKLYSGHRKLLADYMPAHLGVDVTGFLTTMQQTLRPVLRRKPDERVVLQDRPKIVRGA